MKQYLLYLNHPDNQDVIDMRWQHVIKTLDIVENEVRVYIRGADFITPPHDRELPYATIDGKPKSFENFYEEVIGEKKLDEEKDD